MTHHAVPEPGRPGQFVNNVAAVRSYVPILLSLSSQLARSKIDIGMDPDSGSIPDLSRIRPGFFSRDRLLKNLLVILWGRECTVR